MAKPIWSDMLSVQWQTADELSDLLGDDHDLAVFRTARLVRSWTIHGVIGPFLLS